MRLRSKLGLIGTLLLFAGCVEENPDYVFATEGSSGGTAGTMGPATDAGPTGADSTAAGSGDGSGTGDCTDEVCDGVDNDCDDEIDEGCDCIDGEQEDCFTADPRLEGMGECIAGTRECVDGAWGACEDEVVPSPEECNSLDDDCDGDVDEDFGEVSCGEGICMVTVQVCVDGETQECVPGDPVDEECNGFDDDCDGEVDEIMCECLNGEVQDCYTGPMGTVGVGICMMGTQECVDGMWAACVGDQTPLPEVCDDVDNNCDGVVDDGDPGGGAPCGTGLPGLCAQGTTACIAGVVECEQTVFAEPEICDGFDNDCDTGIDEANPEGGMPCSTGVPGECDAGETLCQAGVLVCDQVVFPAAEACNGLDDDCDGTADEGDPEGGQACLTAEPGACANGETACTMGVVECVQTVFPVPETCDGVDEDCDGVIDDGAIGGGSSCPTGLPGVCNEGISDCSMGSPICTQTVFASPEVCDGLDNDCDGAVDDGDPGGGGACSTGQPGVCDDGTEACVGGAIVCQPDNVPTPEVCDGLDNDCDGVDDDGDPGGGAPCSTGLPGVCDAGTTECSGGGVVCTQDQPASPETCNGLDDDCDSVVDDGNPGSGAPCSTGLLGVCGAGVTDCAGGAIACDQVNFPAGETCDGLDNDCDGVVDDGNPGGGAPCSTGLDGICAAGTTACAGGVVVCNQNQVPVAEACNGLDDDCDGLIDEGDPGGGGVCNTGLPGVCSAGTTSCNGGAIACNQNVMASAEVCDGLDNDCDGVVDDGDPGGGIVCSTGLPGVCDAGTTSCTGGMVVCDQDVMASAEVCNGQDDDCDGVVDDGDPGGGMGCNTGQPGICSTGTTACAMGAIECQQNEMPVTEVCDGLDNDCDTGVDEGNPGGGLFCSTGLLGECDAGETVCTAGAIDCDQTVFPVAEICDGLDNDCDGTSDEGNPESGMGCDTGLLGACSAGTTDCNMGTLECTQVVFPVAETCDGVDEDCNGLVDDGAIGGGMPCPTGLPGVCSEGVSDCSGGMPVCNQTVFPSMEICNGLDDDCDGVVDNGNPGGGAMCATGQPGVCADGTEQCSGGMIVCEPNTPASAEVCNGLDDDCDGVTDDGDPGGGIGCSTGQPGVCDAGTTQCVGGAVQCNQDVMASPETCNGLDDDCDGVTDDGDPGGGAPCSTGLNGVCDAGTTQCSGGGLVCNQDVMASAESCNGLDDDCDGATDEGNPGGGAYCNTGQQGICADGTTICSGGMLDCDPDLAPAPETCDGLDNDCDGSVDDGDPGGGANCSTGLPGVCSAGTTECNGGSVVCTQDVAATPEVCNGLDDDCDGSVDDGDPGGGANCNTGLLGQCAAGQTQCVGGGLVCNQVNVPVAESCNGLDDDCDGVVDDGNPGGGAPCSTGLLGVCDSGTTQCNGGGLVCNQDVFASAEVCDGLDNDCDGLVDEGDPGGGGVCNTGLAGVCSAGTTSCEMGGLVCNQDVAASAELCNGLDDDCDGVVDDGNPEGGGVCSTGQPGVCDAGTLDCVGGGLVCSQDTAPSAELCDGLDNDCDGVADEGDPGGGAPCNTGLQGICAAGTTQCAGGAVVCSQDQMPIAEVCGNGLDDDCNGVVDNGCCTETVLDNGFEAGTPNPNWTESSTNFGTPLCTVAGCGTGNGTGPRGGSTWWGWFGGFDGYELAIVTQDVIIPPNTATLRFWLEIPVCAATIEDTLTVSIDGLPIFVFDNGDPSCGIVGYVEYTADVSGFADGAMHTLEFTGEVFGSGPPMSSITNFMVDDVSLESCI